MMGSHWCLTLADASARKVELPHASKKAAIILNCLSYKLILTAILFPLKNPFLIALIVEPSNKTGRLEEAVNT